MRVGFFGGSFDPVHNGHLSLANQLMKIHHLDEVWFCPAALNPLKSDKPASGEDRLNMLRLAIEGTSGFRVIDDELKRDTPSYTIDTLRRLVKKNSHIQFHLLLGQDAIENFSKWHNVEELVQLVPLIIGRRGQNEPLFLEKILNADVKNAILKGMTETELMNVSATAIRESLRHKESCEKLIPLKVMDYIVAHHLYLDV